MVMLVILIMGVTFFLISALSKISLQTARNEKAADLLAQAKDVVIGNAVAAIGGQRLGGLLRPDVLSTSESPRDYDGMAQTGCLNSSDPTGMAIPSLPTISGGANTAKMRCLGRLPWKDYKLPIPSPSENDPTGFMPWYALSANLVDPTCVTSTYDAGFNPECAAINPSRLALNSEILNSSTPPHAWLTVRDMKGNVLSSRVAFVILIPGPALPTQSRPPSPALAGANQYLDSITVPAGCAAPCVPGTYSNADLDDSFIMGDEQRWIDDPANPGKQIADPNYNFNDKLLYVTIDDLMPLIEKRMAREVKACLDDYAAATGNTGHKYPWAAVVSDTTAYPNRPGTYDVRFGRLPEIANTSTTSGGTPPTDPLLVLKITAVQVALTAYLNAPSAATMTALRTAGDALKDYTPTDPAHTAGTIADNCTLASCDTTLLQSRINESLGGGNPDATMPVSWSTVASCNTLFNTSYWADWRDLVFYQVAGGFQPGGGGACVSCLNITGSGNPVSGSGTYRAAVIIAGKMLAGQTRPSTGNPPSNYLEAAVGNAHQSQAGTAPSTDFTTYKPSDAANYSTSNDLVLCVDGRNNCL